jgi:hypothetical protein
MVNIRNAATPHRINPATDRGLAQLIGRGSLLPIVSDMAVEDLVMGGHAPLVHNYAEHVGYPLSDRDEMHRMVKYQALTTGWKDRQLKQDYMDAVGSHLYYLAQQSGADPDVLEEALEQAAGQTVSQFAANLGYPRLGNGNNHPLVILANLPLPIYITTSPYTFLETALRLAGKAPRTDFCRWHAGLGNLPSLLDRTGLEEGEFPCEHNRPESPYQPCPHKPLVYHLYGLDAYPDSLVLTEDDYLDFLMAIYQGRGKDRGVDPVHDVVKGALQSSALLLLGFSLSTWGFRALYRGLIKPMPEAKLYERYCCLQLVPSEQEKLYLESYLRQEARFDQIYWETVEEFCHRQLRTHL